MIKITKDYKAIPDGLASDTAQRWTNKALREREKHIAKDHVYRHTSVVESLNKIYAGKCGYCESFLGVSSSLSVDHYRPKKRVKKTEHSGYYWLTYEWSNLLSICWLCNSKKSNEFPLEDKEKRIHQPQNRRMQWVANSESLLSEKPLILNPEIDEPEEYLSINTDGVLAAKNDSQRGSTTIEKCDLNRHGLIKERNMIITEARKRLWDTAFLIRQEVRNGRISRKEEFIRAIWDRFNTELYLLLSRKKPEKEYSLVGKYMLQEFKLFFIDSISDEGTKSVLNKAFVMFSEQVSEEMNNAQGDDFTV